jgi:anti-sigma factor ChrR (cupin superfamily)
MGAFAKSWRREYPTRTIQEPPTSRSAGDMKPGAVIPAHLHKGMAEALYVVEGDFTNEGKQYQAGTSLHFKAGKAHGPHTTKNGCRLLVLWTERSSKESADLSDFTLANQRAA